MESEYKRLGQKVGWRRSVQNGEVLEATRKRCGDAGSGLKSETSKGESCGEREARPTGETTRAAGKKAGGKAERDAERPRACESIERRMGTAVSRRREGGREKATNGSEFRHGEQSRR